MCENVDQECLTVIYTLVNVEVNQSLTLMVCRCVTCHVSGQPIDLYITVFNPQNEI